MDDFKIAKVCVLLATAETVGGIIMWGINTPQSTPVRFLIVAVSFALIGILTVESLRYVDKKREIKFTKTPQNQINKQPTADEIATEVIKKLPNKNMPHSETTASIRLKKIMELDKFFAEKDEKDLQDMFDFPFMMELNVANVISTLKNAKGIKNKGFNHDSYLNEHKNEIIILMNPKFANSSLRRRIVGGLFYMPDHPNKSEVALIILTPKYVKSKNNLLSYENSAILPLPIVGSVKDFNLLVTHYADLLLNIMNDLLQKNPDYYLHYDDIKSSYWHAIDDFYLPRIQLRPQADKIQNAIRQVLNAK